MVPPPRHCTTSAVNVFRTGVAMTRTTSLEQSAAQSQTMWAVQAVAADIFYLDSEVTAQRELFLTAPNRYILTHLLICTVSQKHFYLSITFAKLSDLNIFFHGCRQKLSAHKHIIECSTIVCCCTTLNNCTRDDTKAAARQSQHCIKNKNKIKYGEKLFSIWRMEFLHPAMWHVALESWQWIHQVAAPCNVIRGSGMTYVIEFAQTSAILEFYIWFSFPHITAVDMSFCTSLRNFIQIGPPSTEKNDVLSIFKMAYLTHLGL